MKPVSPVFPGQPQFESSEITIAKDQPEYLPVPALLLGPDGRPVASLQQAREIMTRWELDEEEIKLLIETKSFYYYQSVFQNHCPGCNAELASKMSPVMFSVSEPGTSQPGRSTERIPFETFTGPTCKGSFALGTACGTCEKCLWLKARGLDQLGNGSPNKA